MTSSRRVLQLDHLRLFLLPSPLQVSSRHSKGQRHLQLRTVGRYVCRAPNRHHRKLGQAREQGHFDRDPGTPCRSGRVIASDFDGKVMGPPTAGGTTVRVDSPQGVTVHAAKVVTADISCSNGVINVTDEARLPKKKAFPQRSAGAVRSLATLRKFR